MRKLARLAVLAIVMALLVVMMAPASAITNGEFAEEDHPEVVLLLMEVGGVPAFRCSGTMIEPTILLTAGHCTNGFPDFEFSGMRVSYETDVDNGTNNYPFAGPNSIEAVAWASHPAYETGPFFLNDVGVVKLAAPVPGLATSDYGELPEVDQLDALKTRRGRQDTTFTAVGTGSRRSTPFLSRQTGSG